MARPVGRFNEQKERCYTLLTQLAKPRCWASNEFLAKKLGCSVRQVARYIKALAEENRIVRLQYRYSVSGNLKTKRNVYLKQKVWTPALHVPPNRWVGYVRGKPKVRPAKAPKLPWAKKRESKAAFEARMIQYMCQLHGFDPERVR